MGTEIVFDTRIGEDNTMSGGSNGTAITTVQTKELEVAPTAQMPIPVEVVTSLATIADSLKSISTFLGGQTLPNVLESYSVMQCIGQALNGLLSSQGRNGLDARTIDQDAIDSTHRILKSFEHLKESIQARRSGEHSGEFVDAEQKFRDWVEQQNKAKE